MLQNKAMAGGLLQRCVQHRRERRRPDAAGSEVRHRRCDTVDQDLKRAEWKVKRVSDSHG